MIPIVWYSGKGKSVKKNQQLSKVWGEGTVALIGKAHGVFFVGAGVK